jgi:hypothetical protein
LRYRIVILPVGNGFLLRAGFGAFGVAVSVRVTETSEGGPIDGVHANCLLEKNSLCNLYAGFIASGALITARKSIFSRLYVARGRRKQNG